jgi:hypothetical protein
LGISVRGFNIHVAGVPAGSDAISTADATETKRSEVIGGCRMKITIDGDIVAFKPENETEMKDLTSLWDLIVDCVRYNKKLVPIGEYVPIKENVAQFSVEEQFTQ